MYGRFSDRTVRPPPYCNIRRWSKLVLASWKHEKKFHPGGDEYRRISEPALPIYPLSPPSWFNILPSKNKIQPAKYRRIFSHVTKPRTQFRSSLCDKTSEKRLSLKCTQKGKCFEQNFNSAWLQRAKSATVTCNGMNAITWSHNSVSCWLILSVLIAVNSLWG